MQTIVSFRKCAGYDPGLVKNTLLQLLSDLGGAEKYFKKDLKVLIKPNFLSQDKSLKGIITHPVFTRAAAEIAIDCGSKVVIGDSAGIGSVMGILKGAGFGDYFKDLPVRIVDFNKPVETRNLQGRLYRKFLIDREVLDAEFILNLPKVKTHGQMLTSFAVKNMFGCVVGKSKPQWHLNAGNDANDFARMLVELHYLIKPGLNLIDGIIGMEGNGPAAGTPVKLGFIAGSEDATALDRALCRVLCIDPGKSFTICAADSMVLGTRETDTVWKGDPQASLEIKAYRLPEVVSSAILGLPDFVQRVLKNSLTTKPLIRHDMCTLCRTCIEQCPAGAMSVADDNSVRKFVSINYHGCIRCFCCQEICPEEAIGIKSGWILKMLNKVKT